MTIARKAPPGQGLLGLSPSMIRLAMTPGPLQASMATKVFASPAHEAAKLATWAKAARDFSALATIPSVGRVGDFDLTERVTWQDGLAPMLPPSDASLTAGDEPFLHVIFKLRDGEELHFSDIDRPVGQGKKQLQLEGRVIEVSPVARRFAEARGLARSLTTIRLRNEDGALNFLLRDPTDGFFQVEVSIRVGFRHLPPSLYRPLGGGWSISRVTSVDAMSVTLELAEKGDVRMGAVRRLPRIRDFRDAAVEQIHQVAKEVGSGWVKGIFFPSADSLDMTAPLIFGREVAQIQHFSSHVAPSYRDRAIGAYVLGCSRYANAAPAMADLIAEEDATVGDAEQRFRLLVPMSGTFERLLSYKAKLPEGMKRVPWVFARVRRVETKVEGVKWWVWILVIGSRFSTKTDGEVRAAKEAAAWTERNVLDQPVPVLIQWPGGAEGSQAYDTEIHRPWVASHDPASVAQDIAFRYLDPAPTIDAASFAEVRSVSDRDWRTTKLAGELTEGQTGAETFDAIGRCFGLDFWWASDGKLHVRTAQVSLRDIDQRIPAARTYDARWDILRDSWQETIPLASERWGIANTMRIEGTKEHGHEEDMTWVGHEERQAWGRTLEADIDLTWRDRWRGASKADLPNLSRFHHRISFRAGLQALELELGDYLRITHWAGVAEEGGYRERLVRIEGITLDWSGKQTQIDAVDMGWVEEENPGFLDSEKHWVRFQRLQADGIHAVKPTASDTTLDLSGASFKRANIKPGDFLILIHGKSETTYRLESVASAPSGLLVTIDEAASLAGDVHTFRVERSHLDPPTNEEFPGKYPLTDRFYTRLADEVSGQFSDGTPAYRLLPE